MFKSVYYDSYENKMHLWEIGENGKTVYNCYDHEISYYVDDVTNTSEIRDIYGNRVIRKVASSKQNLKTLKDAGVKLYESDLSEEVKFLHTRYGDNEDHINYDNYNIFNLDIENEYPDTETINLIGLQDMKTGQIYQFGLKPYLPKNNEIYRHCDTEQTLLEDFCKFLKYKKIDILVGWNIAEFDIPQIQSRIDFHKLKCSMSPIKKITRKKKQIVIAGIQILDMMVLYKKFSFKNHPSFSLNYIANEVIQEGKLDFEGSLNTLWKTDWATFCLYNGQDLDLLKKLEEKLQYIQLAIRFGTQTRTPFERVTSTIAVVEGYMIRYMHRENIIMSDSLFDRDSDDDDESIEGGYVFTMPGFYNYLESVDATSLYPSGMRMFNISPETKVLNPTDTTNLISTPVDGLFYKKDKQGLLPKVITDIFKERKEFQRLKDAARENNDSDMESFYDSQQLIRKILINCFHKNTKILTDTGIKDVKDVVVGELVYSMNPVTRVVELKPVVDVVKKHFTGNLVSFASSRVKLRVTPDHDMLEYDNHGYVKKTKAKEFLNRKKYNGVSHEQMTYETEPYIYLSNYISDVDNYYFIIEKNIDTRYATADLEKLFPTNTPCVLNISRTNRKQLKFLDRQLTNDEIDLLETEGYISYLKNKRDAKCSRIKIKQDINEFSSFVGWYLSEGSIYTSNYKEYDSSIRGISRKITISQHKSVNPDNYNIIDTLFSRMFTKYTKDSKGISVCNDALSDILENNFGKGFEKRIYKMPLGKKLNKQKLFDSMYAGDGNKNRFRYTITQKNEPFVNDYVRLCVELGIIPRVVADGDLNDNGTYRIVKRNETTVFRENITEEPYDDMVYCVNVQDNHTVFVGEDGMFMWSGQCMYGVLANKYFHFFDLDNAAAVTAIGRNAIKYISKCVNDYFSKAFPMIATKYYANYNTKMTVPDVICIVNDTDSAYIWTEHIYKNANTDMSFLDFSLDFDKRILNPFLEKCMTIYAEKYNTENLIYFKREKIILKMYVQAKKKYLTYIIADEKKVYDKPTMKITGIEINRSDLCKYSKGTIKLLANLMFEGDKPDKNNMLNFIRKCHAEFKSQLIEDIATPKAVKGYTKYSVPLDQDMSFMSRTPIHNKASMIYNYVIKELNAPYSPITDGTKMKFVFVKKNIKQNNKLKSLDVLKHDPSIGFVGNYPSIFNELFVVDYEEQFKTQFLNVAQRMFDTLKFGEIILKESKLKSLLEEE